MKLYDSERIWDVNETTGGDAKPVAEQCAFTFNDNQCHLNIGHQGAHMRNTKSTAKPFDLVTNIMAYEQGDLGEDETIELFQYLVTSGLAWSLQGSYGRTAMEYISAGLVKRF